jgi:acyl-CoA synthetase (AMP-forming)/AMP-acid ligase II
MEQPDSSVQCATLVELLQLRAASQPHRRACAFLDDGETEKASLTYEELDRRARSVALGLGSSIGERGRVLLLFPPGLEFIIAFFGCVYAGLVPIPAYPPERGRLARALPLLKAIAGDAQPAAILTTARIWASIEQLAEAPELRALDWLALEDMTFSAPALWKSPDISGKAPALIQYTSGSTSSPKGVMLSHNNLLHNSGLIRRSFGNSSGSRGVIWLPPYHDMGLIGGILQALYGGFPVTLMSPVAFLLRPLRWLQAISRTRATVSGGPNFAYDLCARKISPEQCSGLDLSSWQVAFTGSEPIHFETIQRFSETFECCGFRREAFYPCYGLAESTLFVTGGPKSAGVRLRKVSDGGSEVPVVGCGRVPPGQQIIIVDPERRLEVGLGEIGEIWLSGPSVALGYWNRPQETGEIFRAHLADTGEGPFLRTGDLGFLQDDELFVTGRLKDLIIIGGRNHYPQDIEWTVEQSHPAFRSGCCAAFSVESSGGERLIIAAEIDHRFLSIRPLRENRVEITDSLAPRHLAQAARQAISEHYELRADRVLLLKPATLPKTTSGKLQRGACKTRFLNGSLETLAEAEL